MVTVTGLVTEESEMEKFKGTPGPWIWDAEGLGSKSLIVFGVGYPIEMTSQENKNLIAAAPELLEALQEMVAIVKKHSYPTPDKPSSNYSRAEVAEAVIAKALGK